VRPRVCILVKASPFSFERHYVEAFRQAADVITVGPCVDKAFLRKWALEEHAGIVEPNDVTIDFDAIDDLRRVLPDGWRPDVVFNISSNTTFERPHVLHAPSALISVDTFQKITDYEVGRRYDLVFAAQRGFVDNFRALGARHAVWCPLGANPALHALDDTEAAHDLSFVGLMEAAVHAERKRIVELLQARLDIAVTTKAYGDDYTRALRQGRIIFNHSALSEVNMRVFEAMAMGRMLLTSRNARQHGLLELFDEGVHFAAYDSDEELLSQARYYLEHEDERERIAAAGRAAVLERHTYGHRVEQMLAEAARMLPGFGAPAAEARDPITARLSRMPGRVLAAGPLPDTTRHALRRQGATEFDRIALPGETHLSRSRYDAVYDWPPPPERWNTIVLSRIGTFPEHWPRVLRALWRALDTGGDLFWVMTAEERDNCNLPAVPDEFAARIRAHDFHLLDTWPIGGGAGRLLRLRKRTRTVKDVLAATHADHDLEAFFYEPGYLASLPDDL